MDNYIVSARKYRPSTFKTVVGQDALTTTLKNAISNNKLAHAYLFCGPRGVGKTTCARIFAKTINCFNLTPDNEACNNCESCVAFNENRSYNIYEMDAASNNSVDDIRDLIDKVRVLPQIGKYKVYIIDEVHMLSTQAFNSFLKTLEEPPKHAVFILATTEKHKIIPTILSRCQVYDFNRISLQDIVDYLTYVAKQENVKVEQEALNVIAQKADGGMRDALSIFDQTVSYTAGNVTYKAVIDNLNVLDYEYYFKLTDAIIQGNVVDSLLILNDILNRGFEGQHIISGLANHFRDLMICKDPRAAMLFEVGASIKERYINMAIECSYDFLYKAIEIANDCDLNYRISQNRRLLLELALIKMAQLNDGVGEVKIKATIKQIDTAYVEDKTTKEVEHTKQPSQEKLQSTVDNEDDIENRLTERDPHYVPYPPKKEERISTDSPISRETSESTKEKEKTVQQNTPKTFSISSHGISISALDKEEEETEQTDNIQNQDRAQSYSEEALVQAWKDYAATLKEEKLLKNTMSIYLPKKINDTQFEVTVNTDINREYLENNTGSIINWLRNKLHNDLIEMNILVSETIVHKRPFTPQEIFEDMSVKNPALKKLFDNLGLELK